MTQYTITMFIDNVIEMPKSMSYFQEIHITEKRKSIENQTNQKPIIMETQTTNVQRSCTPPLKTPEEEIDRAFEIIEKI